MRYGNKVSIERRYLYTGRVWCPKTKNSTWLARRRGTVYFTGNSDRVPEVQGRGGFLAHPRAEGMSITGMADYKPQDLEDLDNVIKYYLEDHNQTRREEMRLNGYEWTKQHHTCSRRLLQILNYLSESTGKEFN